MISIRCKAPLREPIQHRTVYESSRDEIFTVGDSLDVSIMPLAAEKSPEVG